jgi:hypothetical protein
MFSSIRFTTVSSADSRFLRDLDDNFLVATIRLSNREMSLVGLRGNVRPNDNGKTHSS